MTARGHFIDPNAEGHFAAVDVTITSGCTTGSSARTWEAVAVQRGLADPARRAQVVRRPASTRRRIRLRHRRRVSAAAIAAARQ
jgi:hypothetical protein